MASILQRMTALSECLLDQIIRDESPEPCWSGVMPGQAALIEALGNHCPGGLAWVRLASAYPSEIVGQQSQRVGNCGSGTGFDLEVGIMRMVEVEEEAPSPEQSLEAVEQQLKDMGTMRRAITCCDALPDPDYILGTYTPSGPLGGVVGGTWSVFVGL